MVVDPIIANPVTGESSTSQVLLRAIMVAHLQLRNGDPLTANVLFTLDGNATGFTQPMGRY